MKPRTSLRRKEEHRRSRIALFVAVFAFGSASALGALPAGAQAAHWGADPGSAPWIGGNPYAVRDWSRDRPFVDLVRSARPFGAASAPWVQGVPLDEDGWPLTDFGVTVLTDQDGALGLGGRYLVDFLGTVASVVTVASPGDTVSHTYDPATGRTTLEIDVPDDPGQLFLGFNGTAGGVSDLRVLQPGAPATAIFRDDYLAHHARFDFLRFLDVFDTNGNALREWSERPLVTDARWSNETVSFPDGRTGGLGAPVEVAIALSNALGRAPWLTVPHRASDDYVTRLAELVRDTLDPELPVYVEYSNETWNSPFPQYGDILALAQASVAAGDPLGLDADGQGSGQHLVWRYTAARIVRIGEIFRAVFGAVGEAARVRAVLAGHVARPSVLEDQLQYLIAQHGWPGDLLYAAAGGPYIQAPVDATSTVDEILDALERSVAGMDPACRVDSYLPGAGEPGLCERARDLRRHAALARFHGLAYLAYEGGPDLEGGGGGTPAAPAAQRAASLDPRMEALLADAMRHWLAWGFGEYALYQSGASNYDRRWFGVTDDLGHDASAKLRAIDALRSAPAPPVRAGEGVPGLIDPRRDAARPVDWDPPGSDPWVVMGAGARRTYLLRASEARLFDLRLRASSGTGATVGIAANGVDLGVVAVAGAGLGNGVLTALVDLPLDGGLNALRVEVASGEIWLDALDVRQRPRACGLGAELSCVAAALALARRRGRRRGAALSCAPSRSKENADGQEDRLVLQPQGVNDLHASVQVPGRQWNRSA